MLQNNVNSVLITQHHQPIGVINDRDVLREIAEEQRNPRKTQAKDLRFTPLIILQGNESITRAMKIMNERGFKRAAMVKNGQLIGMLTEETVKKSCTSN
jgi:CBS domain-containing protein